MQFSIRLIRCDNKEQKKTSVYLVKWSVIEVSLFEVYVVHALQYNCLYSSKLAGYYAAQGFTNVIAVLSFDSSGSLSVESLCTFICYVVKLFT